MVTLDVSQSVLMCPKSVSMFYARSYNKIKHSYISQQLHVCVSPLYMCGLYVHDDILSLVLGTYYNNFVTCDGLHCALVDHALIPGHGRCAQATAGYMISV